MSKLTRVIIGNNVRKIRKGLGLSLLNFSILCELSKASIVNIEAAKSGYNLNLLENIVNFTKFSVSKLSDEEFTLKNNLRDELLEIYKGNDTFYALLNQKPNLSHTIEQKLLKSNFLDTPKEVREIRDYLSGLGLTYNRASISIALKRMYDMIKAEPHPSKKGTFVYSKK